MRNQTVFGKAFAEETTTSSRRVALVTGGMGGLGAASAGGCMMPG
jgi:hypothetical protein